MFTEVVVAPAFDDDALATLDGEGEPARARRPRRRGPLPLDVRPIDGGLLVQQPDTVDARPRRVAGRHRAPRRPTPSGTTSRSPGRCAPRSARNAIVYVRDRQAVGIGAGQQNRLDSARIAAEPGRRSGRGRGVCASDAFFPFRDGLDVAADAGVIRP